ncbi:MAG: DUF3570 domain-containing protein [Chlorobium sp.]|jgi:hypothetical protein|nr:DUF3570 domain-containing protein [Chlorobium sp.]
MKSVPTRTTYIGAAIFAAAMALPLSQVAFAEAAPEKGIVAFKYLNYEDRDSNPEQNRISVNAFSVMGMAPVAGEWSITTTYTKDTLSGASPSAHTKYSTNFVSGASKMTEERNAVDLGVTRYFQRGTVTLGNSYSAENDYISRSISAQGSLSTEDKNTTFTLGGSYTTDTIEPTDETDINGNQTTYDKRTVAGLFGVTRVLTKEDIVQLNFGYSRGKGDFNDHYKEREQRPDRRESKTVMTRWNHHFNGIDGTSRLSYRYYTDTFGINAHTIGLEYVQPFENDWIITPSARYFSQNAADFYFPVDPATWSGISQAARDAYNAGEPVSLDQRLSAFGAITLGIKIEKKIAKEWLVDAKYEHYEQHARWSMSGGGDKELATFNARFIQFGISRQF